MTTLRVVCIHQPPWLPWLGIVESMLVCDVFVVYDDVPFEDGGVQNRNKIKTANGPHWLTVPVRKRAGQLVREVEIGGAFNPVKLLKTVHMNYARAPYFQHYFPSLQSVILGQAWEKLVDLNMALLRLLRELIGAKCEFVTPQELDVPQLDREERLPLLCNVALREKARCEPGDRCVMYSGTGMRGYLPEAEALFASAGITLVWHNYQRRHEVYSQLFMGRGFIPCLAWIDMLLNCGAEDMRRRLLESGQQQLATLGQTLEVGGQERVIHGK